MRLAYVGPTPTNGAGVGYAASLIVDELSRYASGLDCFVTGDLAGVPERLLGRDELCFVAQPSRWKYDRVYSRGNGLVQFTSGQASRAVSQYASGQAVAERHRRAPYRALYQFSQIESFASLGPRARLPPLILHPETHAAGELRWHRREAHLARQAERPWLTIGARTMLTARAAAQGRAVHAACGIIAPSVAFARSISEDYRIPTARIRVVPNPIDLDRFALPPEDRGSADGRPVRLLFISRMAVRKGVELIVALSHRLTDLAGLVAIEAIGDHSVWSDYRSLLSELEPRVARYRGPLTPQEVAEALRGAEGLLQPSHYEPFGLTVGEALATGVPVVVSDAVGAGEELDPRCCRVVAAGQIDKLEAATRTLIADMSSAVAPDLRRIARHEAERRFAPAVVGRQLTGALDELLGS